MGEKNLELFQKKKEVTESQPRNMGLLSLWHCQNGIASFGSSEFSFFFYLHSREM